MYTRGLSFAWPQILPEGSAKVRIKAKQKVLYKTYYKTYIRP